jgi:putative FmdB family regulatory protein
MPIYEYTCVKCGNPFEHLVRRRDEAAPHCPKCGAARPRKELSAFSTVAALGDPCAGAASCATRSRSCAGGGCPFSAAHA